MKTDNEEKHKENKDESKERSASSDQNKERKIILRKPSEGRDSGQPRQQQSYQDNRKRRPRVGERGYSSDQRDRPSSRDRFQTSDRPSPSDRYQPSDRYSSSPDRGEHRSNYPPSRRDGAGVGAGRGRGYGQGHGQKKVIKPLKKKVPFKQIKYKENADPNAPIRLNKYLANAGVCSRREADNFIQAGAVKVNGEVVSELGTKITRGDNVTFHDKPISLESKVYVLLNKPKGFVTTTDDPENRKTVMDLVKSACSERIYPVGRLDRGTTGVLLLTNDGDLASKLTHPRYEKRKIYQVWVDKPVTIEHMQEIADGVELEDGEILVDAISYVTEEDLTQIGIEIHSGKNRIVRRLFEKFDYRVLKLDRVYFAGLTKKNLSRGRWRYLTEKEVNMLRMGAFD